MNVLVLDIDESARYCLPGSILPGTVRWQLDKPADQIEVRLFFYTEGKGSEDVEMVEAIEVARDSASGERTFEFKLPLAPYSFSGKLISLIWAVELVAMPSGIMTREQIEVSPTGQEIHLDQSGRSV